MKTAWLKPLSMETLLIPKSDNKDSFHGLLKRAVYLPIGLLFCLAIILLWQFERLSVASDWVLHTDEAVDQTRQIQGMLLDMESGLRGYLFGGRIEFLEPYTAAKPKVLPALRKLESMTANNPEQLARVQELGRGIEVWTLYAAQKIELSLGKNPGRNDLTGKSLMDNLRQQIHGILAVEQTLLEKRSSSFKNAEGTLVFLITGGTVLFAIVLGLFARRQLTLLSHRYERILLALAAQVKGLESERTIREIFVSTLTHDLRNPLGVIQMSSEILLENEEEDEDDRLKITKMIYNGSQRANRMIENLLDANRIKAGEKLPLRIESKDLHIIAKETLEDMTLTHGKRFQLETLTSDCRGFWSGDGVRRMLENLCTNAIKYGAVNTPITVKLRKARERLEISVHNLGNPLSPEDQIKLFEPFQRSRSAQESGQEGWGLGLTLVQGIAQAHGGSVRIESSALSGTTFIIRLPRDSRPTLPLKTQPRAAGYQSAFI